MDGNALAYLNDLNRGVETALTMLETLAQYPELNNDGFVILQAYFREQLGDVNVTVLAALEEWEHDQMLAANRKRAAYEREIRDPDDCYLDVARREEERRQQGLPPLLGILHGMRHVTGEEILAGPLEADLEDEEDQEEMDPESEGDRP
jgi:hypothetical protein